MLKTLNMSEYQHWHELLDALCLAQGHLDNMALADALCAAGGNRTQAAFDTAVKNLRNWRVGAHIPQRRNFILLGKILKVDQQEGLREHWNHLYTQSKVKPSEEVEEKLADQPAQQNTSRRSPLMVAAAVAIVALGTAGIAYSFYPASAESEDEGFVGINADYKKNVTVKLGEALIIHGARGDNCGPAPDWEVTKELLPELTTGILSDGGIGTRYSRQCDGRVAARAILFTATTRGTEQTSIYGDPVTINVQ